MYHNVHKDQKDDEKEPYIYKFDGSRVGNGVREVGEERVQYKESGEGHDGSHVEGFQLDEERRPTDRQEEDRRDESSEEDEAQTPLQFELETQKILLVRELEMNVANRVEGQVYRACVWGSAASLSKPDTTTVIIQQVKVDTTLLDVEGVNIQVEGTCEFGSRMTTEGDVVVCAGVQQVWKHNACLLND